MIERVGPLRQWLRSAIRPKTTPSQPWHTDRVSEWRIPLAVLVWIPVTLGLDHGSTLPQQYLLGLLTWVLLLVLLRRESALVQLQTVIVIAFATAVEYTFSPLLEVYTYRFDNVPAFVPPGHGLVYLAALTMGRSELFARYSRPLMRVTVVLGGLYAIWGVSPLAPRPDVLGLFWYGCLLGFLVWGRSRMLYVGAFFVVTYLELIGTWLQIWTWSAHDPTGLVSMGNPPSGAAGGYGWFDLVAISLAPVLARFWERMRSKAGSSVAKEAEQLSM
jgi:hypothetical protein